MRKYLLAISLILFGAQFATAQYTNNITIIEGSEDNIEVTHKASSKSVWLVTLRQLDNTAVNLTNHTPITLGVKTAATDSTFRAMSTGVVQSATAGTVLFTINSAQWVTNIANAVTWYGDVRLTDFDLPLPSLKITLKPGYNTGSESYAAPSNWEWREDGVALTDPTVVDVISPLTASVSGSVLSLGITETGDISAVTVTNPITGGGTSGSVGIGFDGTQTFVASGATTLNGTAISSGTVADARIASTIARDSELPTVTAGTNIDIVSNGVDRAISAGSALATDAEVTTATGTVYAAGTAYADGLAGNYATAAQGTSADAAYSWVNGNSNEWDYVQAQTSEWDIAYMWVNGNSNEWDYVQAQTSVWDIAYGWGDHSTNGYLTTESDPDALMNATGNYEWTTGNVWYVAAGSDIEAAVTAAAAGDTLVLAAGTYTATDDIDITKAIGIVGQGRGKTIIATIADNKKVFHITASSVLLKDMSISIEASGTTGVYVDGTAGTVLSDVICDNLEIENASHAGVQYCIVYEDAGGMVINCHGSGTSTDNGAIGLVHRNVVTGEAPTTLRVFNTEMVMSGTYDDGFFCGDSFTAQNNYLYLYGCRGVAASSAGDALRVYNANCYAYAENCVFDGGQADVRNGTSGFLRLRNCVLVNNKTMGTITRDGWLYTEGLVLNAGAAVTNIATTVTSNDTSLATGAAIMEAIAAGDADGNTAYGWGDHSTNGYVLADVAASGTGTNLSDYANDSGYLTDYTTMMAGDVSAAGGLTNSALINDSMADSLHRHSELSASDGSPNPALNVDTNGYVGIGTATPDALLTVVGNSPSIHIDGIANAYLSVDKGAANRLGTIQYLTGGATKWYVGCADSDNFGDGEDFFIGTTASIPQFMIDDDSGYVGIGTNAPATKLDVNGAATVRGSLTLNTGASPTNIQTTLTDSDTALPTSGAVVDYAQPVDADLTALASGGSNLVNGAVLTTQHYHSILSASDGSPNPALSVDASGNVGIGTNAPAAKAHIVQTAAADAFRVDDVAGDTTPFVIDQSGNVLVGFSTAPVGNIGPSSGPLTIYRSASMLRCSADAFGPKMLFGKDRSATLNDYTSVQNGDGLFDIIAAGADGVDYQSYAARIVAEVDGIPGTNDMPGRLSFWTTPDGSAFSTERMTIKNDGKVGIGDSTPSYTMDINGTLRVTGKATFSGGTDPKYLHTERQTEAQIFAYIKRDIPPSKLNGLVEFFGTVGGQVSKWGWIPSSGKVYNMITGDLEKTVAGLTSDDLDYEYRTEYRLDSERGIIMSEEVAIGVPNWKFKEGYTLDEATGICYDPQTNAVPVAEAIE